MDRGILSKIDYSVLSPPATAERVLEAAERTRELGFATLCVFPKHVRVARTILPESKVCAVIGFPLSPTPLQLKVVEVEFCIDSEAGELDVVADLSAVKEGDWKKVEEELRTIREVADDRILKLIVECCYLTEEEKKTLCRLAADTGWDFVKTSTGYGPYGATIEDVELLKSACNGRVQVKAAGGIRTLEAARKFLEAGAERIGTSSAVKIAEELLHGR
ncbi:MAG: deoxyribose-phosphate aldolase [Desulfurobacteriaceae bacterium]